MSDSLDIRTAFQLVCIVNISFSLGLLLLRSDRVWNGARLWLLGNLFGLSSVLLRLSLDPGWLSTLESILPATLMTITNAFKAAALARKRERGRVAFWGGALVACQLLVAWMDSGRLGINVATFVSGSAVAALLAWQAWICMTEPRWKVLPGSQLFVASTVLISIFALFASARGLGNPAGKVIFSETGPTQLNVMIALSYIIFSHLCLMVMLTGRLNRIITATKLRQRKEARLARQAEAHAREMAALADEKQSLLEVLIHEVRQPLNNAQAALQHAMISLNPQSDDHVAGRRFQAIIDKVVLSLTNAIVGASVLERKSRSELISLDIAAVCHLACSDAGPGWEQYVDLEADEHPILAPADPVLLRLAVRNLVDNAVKHSAPDKKIRVSVRRSANRKDVLISVTNWPAEPFRFEHALVERGARGSNASPEGRGLGLYIAQETASIHHGTLRGRTTSAGETEFVLTLPLQAH